MDEETPQDRQMNELQALQAIFANDVEDIRKPMAWNVWRPLDILLTLRPQYSSITPEVHCSLTLNITCCLDYPNKPPQLTIQKMHGLSHENAAKLLKELNNMAVKLCGEVMIFELAQHVQKFLGEHNKPTKSFYEEMVERNTEMERLKLQDLKMKEDMERQKIKEEIQKQQEIVKNEDLRKKRYNSISHDVEPAAGGDSPELVCYDDNKEIQEIMDHKERSIDLSCTCPSKTITMRIQQRNNRKIYIGNCLGHSANGSITNVALDADTGEMFVAKKWSFKPATVYQTRNRQITLIDSDYKAAYRIKHPVLLPYKALEFASDQNTVFVFRDFVYGCSLHYLSGWSCERSDVQSVKLMRHVASGLFSALAELHSVGVCHNSVRMENVFLNLEGAVKLVGVSLDYRFSEIFENGTDGHRQDKTHDIYSAAVLLLNLLTKNQINLEIPSHLPSIVKDFFSKCLTEDTFQWTAEQLCGHPFLKDNPTQVSGSREKDDDDYTGNEEGNKQLAKLFVENCLPASHRSRITDEFEIITLLGEGGFGKVLKVRNKLDGGLYAIKHIELNPENGNLNKKIIREVSLLSRLNHENVVRYYNAWIETVGALASDEIDTENTKEKASPQRKTPQKTPERRIKVNNLEDIAAKLAPGVRVEWSILETPVQKDTVSQSLESDDDDEWINPVAEELDDSSSSIEFAEDCKVDSKTLPSESSEATTETESRPPTRLIRQALYIQMEFCEKNTLRQAIDNCLYLENIRAWRLFREIVDGLAYVHAQGILHRDLKPGNVFLDSNDHVKLGDFGLATTSLTTLPKPIDDTHEDIVRPLTGQIGTALYMAPELLERTNKMMYNQKVDIYSLGIILFEIFHPPMKTSTERINVLGALRQKEIIMPAAFEIEQNKKQIKIIKWLLDHDPGKRPACSELIGSTEIPRPMAESALVDLLSHTLKSRATKSYQKLVGACLGQAWTQAEDYTYSSSITKSQDNTLVLIKQCIIKVFKRHLAAEFNPPTLQPRNQAWDHTNNAVKVMTAGGYVVHLPRDLRVPFARYTAYSDVKYMRRYVIDKVYREKSTKTHPREMTECAFDIVTPKTSLLWSDAELLVVAYSAAKALGLQVSFQINHTDILKKVLLSCGISADKHVDLYPVLVDVGTGRISNIQLQTHLTSLCLAPRDTAALLRLLAAAAPADGARALLAGAGAAHSARALTELETVCRTAHALGVDCSMTFMPCLADNATQHGGLFWRLTCSEDKKKPSRRAQGRHHSAPELIAVGGRYNTLVEEFWKVASTQRDETELRTTSVGFTMSLDRVAAILKMKEINIANVMQEPEGLRACVCVGAVGVAGAGAGAGAAGARLARALWAAGGAALAPARAAAEAHELTGAPLVALLADHEPLVAVTRWEGHSVLEERMTEDEFIQSIKQNTQQAHNSEGSSCNRNTSWSETEKMNSSLVSVVVITDEKLTASMRRRYETQATDAAVRRMAAAGMCRRACVFAVRACAAAVRAAAALLDAPLRSDDVRRARADLLAQFPKYEAILRDTIKELEKMTTTKSGDEAPIIALYSIDDKICKLLV